MKKLAPLCLLAALVWSPALPAATQDQSTPTASDDARKARIMANLELHIPQLAQADASIGTIEPTDIEGLEQGTLLIAGQARPFLVTSDDKRLWIVAGPPLDVSRSTEEIAAEVAKQQAEREQALTAAIAGDPVRGHAEAPVTIVEYSDFQCPFCARATQTVEQILAKYPQDVKFVFQHFPLRNHPWAMPAAIASVCAAEQSEEAFWTLHDAYFQNQQAVNPGNVIAKSKEFLGGTEIDLARWEACSTDQASDAYKAAAARVEADLESGQQLGVTGTPGFFVNGEFLSGAQPIASFEPLIEKAKAREGGEG